MSTFGMNGEIVFPSHNGRQAFKIRRFNQVMIESSWKSLTDTAEITIPRRVKDFDRNKIDEWFREGDPVEIKLGYDLDAEMEFSGYIARISAGFPITIDCEDEMYHLKRKQVSVSIQNCTLKELLEKIAPGYNIIGDETKLVGTFRFKDKTAAECLDELKEKGIYCYFSGKDLYAMQTTRRSVGKPTQIIIERTAGESLQQKAVEQTKVIIELIRKIGKKLKVEYGDDEPAKTIRFKYSGDVISEDAMLSEAKDVYKQAKTPGMDGDITLFGIPRMRIGDVVDLKSYMYPNKNGLYYIDSVTKTFGEKGYRQKCKLGDKAI